MRAFRTLSHYFFIAALAVTALLCERGYSAVTKPQLTFTVSPISSSFHEYEKVMLRFTIRNESGTDVLVSSAFILNYDIYLEIENSSGKTIPWCGVIANWVFLGDKYVTLHPGMSLSMSRQISCDESQHSGFSFPGPGQYTVAATYRFPVSPKKLRENPGPVPFASGPYKAQSARITIVANGPSGPAGAER
jgi:hypothetical protein